jgi:hypothetical protein
MVAECLENVSSQSITKDLKPYLKSSLSFIVHLKLNDNALIEVVGRTFNSRGILRTVNCTKRTEKLSSLITSDSSTVLSLNVE